LSTWGARALDRIAIRDSWRPRTKIVGFEVLGSFIKTCAFREKKGDVYEKKARLIARGARAYDVHYDRGRLASVSSPLSFSKA
jgi:hypothetical protein